MGQSILQVRPGMFDWLETELNRVKTRRFYVTHAPTLPIAITRPYQSDLSLPDDYRTFANRFGTTLLFRDGDVYLLRVSARPWRDPSINDGTFICFGGFDDGAAFFSQTA